MKAPFPYFGGKSKVAPVVWSALGNVRHYIEPFFGSGAVLLNRPDFNPAKNVETVNDKDGFVSNVWRSLKYSPDKTAEWCDWPVNHADLMARRKVLLANEGRLLAGLAESDEWHDPKLAGYWIWAASCWIGSGLTRPGAIPHISGVAIPHISGYGMGVHSFGKRPSVCNAGYGINNAENGPVGEWFSDLSARLRNVRVICGEWKRVCGGNWQDHLGPVGIFFDPPYGVKDRDNTIYHHDSTTVAADVLAWCLDRGGRPKYRIVVAGYEEYETLSGHGWTKYSWKAQGGYSNTGRGENKNCERETLWFSPNCVHSGGMLF